MKKVLIYLILFLSFNIYGQSITWQRLYNFGGYSSLGRKSQQTSDSGYITTGYTYSSEDRIFLLKQNKFGDTIWIKNYNGAYAWWVEETYDKGFIIAGTSLGNGCIIKTDSSGNFQWRKIFNNPYGSHCRCAKQTSDSGYILSMDWSDTNLFWKTNISKTDKFGNIIWQKIYGKDVTMVGEILNLNNYGYIIIGVTAVGFNQPTDILITRTDVNGDTLWTKIIGGSYSDKGYSIQFTNDNGFILCGWTESFSNGQLSQSYIIKLDSNGYQQWYKLFSHTGGDASYSIRRINSGYIIAGYSDTLNNGCGRGKIRIIDDYGNLIKETSFAPYNECTVLWSAEKTFDGGYIFSGWAENGNEKAYILKTDSLLYSTPIGINKKGITTAQDFELYQNYPNPFNPTTTIKYKVPKGGVIKFKVYDIAGREIINIELYRQAGEYEYQFDGSKLSSGVYFYQLEYGENILTKKMLLIK